MKSVFVIWQDVEDGMWHPVAKLTRENDIYRFNYTQGAKHTNFIPFPRMSDKEKVYVSNDLFAFFRNRLLPQTRPEFKKVLEWSGMTQDTYDELEMLSITGGSRQTDEFRIIALPEQTSDSKYNITFFINGIRHLPQDNIDRIAELISGDSLTFECEDDNKFDCNAVLAMTTDKEKLKVGYCPKYFNKDIRLLMTAPELQNYELTVVKVNHTAPAQYRLLCEFKTTWPKGFIPLMSTDYLAYNPTKEPVTV